MSGMKRVSSFLVETENFPSNNLLEGYRRILKELHLVKLQLKMMKQEIDGFEEGMNQWTMKYTKRMVMVSNVLLSVFMMGNKANDIIFNSSFIRQMIFPWKKSKEIKVVEHIWKESILSFLLVVSTMWINTKSEWKKNMSLLISLLISVYLSLFSDISPWALYFNIFALILYIASLLSSQGASSNTQKD